MCQCRFKKPFVIFIPCSPKTITHTHTHMRSCAYNELKTQYASTNKKGDKAGLFKRFLRNEFSSFDALVEPGLKYLYEMFREAMCNKNVSCRNKTRQVKVEEKLGHTWKYITHYSASLCNCTSGPETVCLSLPVPLCSDWPTCERLPVDQVRTAPSSPTVQPSQNDCRTVGQSVASEVPWTYKNTSQSLTFSSF